MFAIHDLNQEMHVCDGEPSRHLSERYRLQNFRMVHFLPGTRLGRKKGGWAVGFVANGKFMQIHNLPVTDDGRPYLDTNIVHEVGRRVRPRNLTAEHDRFASDESEGMRMFEQADENTASIWRTLQRKSRGLGGNMDKIGHYNDIE